MERKKRRSFTINEKNDILREHSLKGTPIPVLARLNDVHPITLYNWKRKMTNESSVDVKALLREIEQLKKDKNKLLKKVGELTLSEEVGQDIIEFYKKKILEQKLQEQENLSNKKRKGVRK